MFVALALLCLGLWLSNHDFLSQSNLVNTSRQISMLGIFSIGMAFVIVAGGIDLSVGSIVGLTGVLIAKFSSTSPDCLGLSYGIGIPLALSIVLLIGLAQGMLIAYLDLQPFIVTLGGMLLLRGVSQTIVRGGTLSFGANSQFPDLANGGLFLYHGDPLLPYPLIIFIVVALLAAYLLHATVFGRHVYAVGGNREAAHYSGINVKIVETLTYVISAGLAGVAGVCYAAYIGQMSQQVGIAYELYAIAAVVIGGCSLRGGQGTVFGVMVGSAIMRVIDNGINMFQFHYTSPQGLPRIWRLNPNWNYVIIGSVILIAVIFDQLTHLLQTRRAARTPAAPKPHRE